MTNDAGVAVIVPCYNQAPYVGEALLSLSRQTRVADEIVVVDDGSTDGSPDVVLRVMEQWPGRSPVRLVCHDVNTGFVTALERGFAETTAPMVAHVDADDLVRPRYLEALTHALHRHPDAGFAYPRMELFGDESGLFMTGEFRAGRLLFDGNYIPHIGMMRRAAFEASHGYRPLPTHVDWDLWLALLTAGYRGVFVDEVLYDWRRHGGSMTLQPTGERLRVRMDILWHHRRLLARHLHVAPYWFGRSVSRRLIARVAPERARYRRTPSCWAEGQ
ncbi:MAG: glycosyltransferase family 2 protein [Actinomycetes bacterium]